MASSATRPGRRAIDGPWADRAEIERAISLIFEPGDVVEVRIPKTRAGVVAGYFDSPSIMADGVSLLPGERRRERGLSLTEEAAYLESARDIGEGVLDAYRRALEGIRAKDRGQQPIKPEEPYLLRDVATLLLDCGVRPEECYRLRWEQVRGGALHVAYGKTANARRSIPLSKRAEAVLEMRRLAAASEWVFPAPTKSGHIEQSTLRKKHEKACTVAGLDHFPFYTFRHTCLTKWSQHMDPYTLAYFAGHSEFGTTRRYVHPNMESGRAAMERAGAGAALGGHSSGHTNRVDQFGTQRKGGRTPSEGERVVWYAR